MKVELRKNGGPKITADREGLHALRELLGAALEVGHGFQSDGTLPEVVVVDERGKVMLPARPEKRVWAPDEKEDLDKLVADLDPDYVANLKRLYAGADPTSGHYAPSHQQQAAAELELRRRGLHKEPAEPGIEAERLDSGQE
jgi:hypothetical protein